MAVASGNSFNNPSCCPTLKMPAKRPSGSFCPPTVSMAGPMISAAPTRYDDRNADDVVRHHAEQASDSEPTCSAVTLSAQASCPISNASTPPKLYATASNGVESSTNDAIGTRRPNSFSNTIVHGPSLVSSNSDSVSRSFSLVSTPQVMAGRNRYSPANWRYARASNNSRPFPIMANELLLQLPS